ncbi:MAG: type IV secretory system conjugative DNA transfer family protein [Firmicutes bacterium]|nr:type IV secretory system conjugative DNA transfer family protein [Bacillota bacterium]
MKIKAEKKDWIKFIVFALALFYLSTLIVENLGNWANYGIVDPYIWLFPYHIYMPVRLAASILVFIVLLVWVLTSVSSLIFDKEKGVGFTVKKKESDGYSHWANEKEIKAQLKMVRVTDEKMKYGGLPLINNGKEIYVDDGESHSLIIGSTGSGKTQYMVLPAVKILARKGESMIITDPKGEIYEETAEMLKEKGYNIVLLNFRDPQKGNAWNPLYLPYSLYKEGNVDKAIELLDDLAANILYDEKAQNQDPFWEKSSADYFSGLALGLFDDAKPDEINLNSINLMSTIGEERCGASTYIREYFSTKDAASSAYVNASSVLMAPSETKGGILAVFKQKVKLFTSREVLSEMLAHNDFDMKDIGRQKTAVFIVIQDEKKTYHSLVTIFIKQCYETLIDVAQECGGKLPYRTNFILDEFANMPPLKDVTTMVTAARSRLIRFNFIIQNFAQLNQIYGKEQADTIKGNCGNIIYLISTEIAALEEISKLCGEKKSKEKDKTASTPLITVSDLQRLKQGETIILRTRQWPFKTKLVMNWKIDWGKKYDKAGYPTREKLSIPMFDVKEFVDKVKADKFQNMVGNMNENTPFPFGNPSSNPFGGNLFMNNQDNGINLDDVVKRIDAKIAELEAEEAASKESADWSFDEQKDIPKVIDEVKDNNEVNDVEVLEDNSTKANIEKSEVDNSKVEASKTKDEVTDDEFFDDFWSDGE